MPADDKVYVQTYSPWLNQFETDADSEFTLDFPMGGAFSTAGTHDGAERRDWRRCRVSGLEPNTAYEWRADRDQRGRQEPHRPGVAVHDRQRAAPINQPPTANSQSVRRVRRHGDARHARPARTPTAIPLTYAIVGWSRARIAQRQCAGR